MNVNLTQQITRTLVSHKFYSKFENELKFLRLKHQHFICKFLTFSCADPRTQFLLCPDLPQFLINLSNQPKTKTSSGVIRVKIHS